MVIYIIRHGRTVWNKDTRWQGQTDIELDETGIIQAAGLGLRLKDCNISALYSSPLLRARATAEAIGRELNLRPFFRDGLKEVAFGRWEGLTVAQVYERYPEAMRIWESEPDKEPGFGVESYGRLRDRAVSAITDICKAHGNGEAIAIVSHGALIRAFLVDIMNIPLASRLCFELDNAGVTIVKYDANRNKFRVCTLNEQGRKNDY